MKLSAKTPVLIHSACVTYSQAEQAASANPQVSSGCLRPSIFKLQQPRTQTRDPSSDVLDEGLPARCALPDRLRNLELHRV
jgi:hypothetical protein